MPKYRDALPQLNNRFFLTDGGIETTLIFNEGIDLPDFAAFDLVKTAEGRAALRKYFDTYAEIARRHKVGLILESPTWRANPEWATRLGYSAEELAAANSAAIGMLVEVRAEFESDLTPIVISGCIGPRGDGYIADSAMNPGQAQAYHSIQIETFAESEADMVSAITMNYVEEALGLTLAARDAGMPVAVSFTVETDGRLPTGDTLESAIERVDAATSAYPAYYMINCAHPTHFADVIDKGGSWRDRIHGLRANASRRSHQELNEAPEVDAGDPDELARQYADIRRSLTRLNVMGGCCGTDHRHIEKIAEVNAPS
jgi:S-methylmethionine-dependent homocysteine/selenocysteine methylase